MELEVLDDKEDGWNLIVEEYYNLEKVKEYLKNSCLAEKCEFLNEIDEVTDENVERLCSSLLALENESPLSLDELTTLFVAACMIFTLDDASIESSESRTSLLHGVFFHTDTLRPQHLHVAVERIWESLKIEDTTNYVMNILSICRELVAVNPTGKAIAICLAWAILSEITETEVEMYCFQEFSMINKMLREIDEDVLRLDESTQVIYILIQVVGFLINTIVFGSKEEFVKSGYRHYFEYKRQDLEKLKEWAEQLSNFFGVTASKPSNYWDLRMSMTDYIKMNIVSLLQDKIRDME